MNSTVNVVCLHGLGLPSKGMYMIGKRLERDYGWRAFLFGYPSLTGTLDDNAAALAEFIEARGFESVHLIGHSLGGVVALRMLARHPHTVPGRVVCIGSPLRGSRPARVLESRRFTRRLVVPSLKAGVLGDTASDWAAEVCERREIGVIAGTKGLGMGRLVARFPEPNDGTVGVSETRLPGAKDHLCMAVSHNRMLVSAAVTDQAVAFLKRGEFLREAESLIATGP